VVPVSLSKNSGEVWRGPQPSPFSIVFGGMYGENGHFPKAQATENAFPLRFPPGNSAEFQGIGLASVKKGTFLTD